MEITKGMYAGRKIGGVAGLIFFLIFGIVPGYYFGSYGVMVTLHHLMGGHVEENILVKLFLAVGIALGVFCIGAVTIVLGSVAGVTIGYITDKVRGTDTEAPANH